MLTISYIEDLTQFGGMWINSAHQPAQKLLVSGNKSQNETTFFDFFFSMNSAALGGLESLQLDTRKTVLLVEETLLRVGRRNVS